MFCFRGAGWSTSAAGGKANCCWLGAVGQATVSCGGRCQWTVVQWGSVISGCISDVVGLAWSIDRPPGITGLSACCSAAARSFRSCWADSLLNCRCLILSRPQLHLSMRCCYYRFICQSVPDTSRFLDRVICFDRSWVPVTHRVFDTSQVPIAKRVHLTPIFWIILLSYTHVVQWSSG